MVDKNAPKRTASEKDPRDPKKPIGLRLRRTLQARLHKAALAAGETANVFIERAVEQRVGHFLDGKR